MEAVAGLRSESSTAVLAWPAYYRTDNMLDTDLALEVAEFFRLDDMEGSILGEVEQSVLNGRHWLVIWESLDMNKN